MGVWGTGFWQNDVALDVKADFKKYFKYGATDEEGLNYVIKNTIDINDEDDGAVVTMVIAEQLRRLGRLTDEWLEKASAAAEYDMDYWKENSDNKSYKQRTKVLEKYLQNLRMPQPEPKPINRKPMPDPFVNTWVRGDVIAVKNKKSIYMLKERRGPFEYYEGGIVVLIVEEIHDEFISVFAKFDPMIRDFDELDRVSIEKMPFILKRIDLHLYFEKQKKKFKYIGNYTDLLIRNDIDDTHPFHSTIDQLTQDVVCLYFRSCENYWKAAVIGE